MRPIDEGWLLGYLYQQLSQWRATTDVGASLRLSLAQIEQEQRSGSRVHLVLAVMSAAILALVRLDRFEPAIVGDEFTRAASMAIPFFDRGVTWAEAHVPPKRIAELREQARRMTFGDFAAYARGEIEAALAKLESA